MSYLDEKISFEEVYEQELNHVFPIFRFNTKAKIFAILCIGIPLIYQLISDILDGFAVFGICVFVISLIMISFIYKMYVEDNTQYLFVLCAIRFGIMVWERQWIPLIFFIWFILALYFTNKAEQSAHRRFADISEAQRESQRRRDAKTVTDPATYSSMPDLDSDDELDSFEMPNNNGANAFASPFAPMGNPTFGDADASRVEVTEEGKKLSNDAPKYCPKCTFALMPGEDVCPRCGI